MASWEEKGHSAILQLRILDALWTAAAQSAYGAHMTDGAYEYEHPNPYGYDGPAHERADGCRNFALGCLVALLLMVGIVSVGGYFLFRSAKRITAEAAVQAVEHGIQQTELSEEQRTAIIERVEELAEDFRSGELTLEEIAEIGEQIVESRAVIAGGAEFVVRRHILDQVELSDEELAHANRLIQRLARGIVEEQLEMSDFESIKDIVLIDQGEGNYRLKEDLSQDDVEKFMGELEKLVDEAGVPDEPYEVDIASELDRIVESARGGP